jgi:hypothetical protein
VCGGKNDCVGCDGVFLSSVKYDLCGVCGGANACIQERPRTQQTAVFVLWGIADIDRSGRSAASLAAGDIGDPVYDENFNFANPAAQEAMLSLSARIESADPPLVAGPPNSFIAAFRAWIVDVQKLAWPVQTGGVQLLCEFIAANQGFASEVVFNTSTIVPPLPMVGRKRASNACFASDLKLLAARVRYSSYQLEAATPSFPAFEVFERWQALFDDFNSDVGLRSEAPATLTSDKWVSSATEVGTVRGVIYGVAVSAIIAFVCLLVFTSNFLVALLAIFSQISSTFCTLGVYYLAGWKMGAIEAISVTVLVGIVLDYFFHIAEAYSVSSEYARKERTRDAFTRMGVNVLAGAITTGGAMILILGAQVEIFYKFGVIVVVNTAFAILYVFVFFAAYLTTVGPSGDFGSLKRLFQIVTGPCRTKLARQSSVVHVTPVATASEEPSSDGSERGRSALADHDDDDKSESEVVEVGRKGKAAAAAAKAEVTEDDDDDETEEPSSEMSFGDLKDRK